MKIIIYRVLFVNGLVFFFAMRMTLSKNACGINESTGSYSIHRMERADNSEKEFGLHDNPRNIH